MSYFEAVILGLIQGLAEFLPISSSGHLALMQQWFGIEEDKVLLFAVLLHVGTLVSVFIVYWKDVWELIKELGLTIRDIFTGRGLRIQERPTRKLGVMIIVATIPTGIIGILFNDFFNSLYNSVIPIGIGLIITGFLLIPFRLHPVWKPYVQSGQKVCCKIRLPDIHTIHIGVSCNGSSGCNTERSGTRTAGADIGRHGCCSHFRSDSH